LFLGAEKNDDGGSSIFGEKLLVLGEVWWRKKVGSGVSYGDGAKFWGFMVPSMKKIQKLRWRGACCLVEEDDVWGACSACVYGRR